MRHDMLAAIAESHGCFNTMASISRPKPQAGQVLVRISASGLNPLDAKILAEQASHARQPLPAILGLDLAGTVEDVASDVTTFRRGDEVYGMGGGVGGLQGSLAEYAAVDAGLLALKPINLTMREAASLPLVLITAWEGLVDRAQVRAGQTVLVQGGAGGVGRIVTQIATATGARVFATGSPSDHDEIARLGATPIDYRASTVAQYVREHTDGQGFDIVYDTVGGPTLDASFEAVRRFGHVVSCLGWGTHALAPLSFRAASYSGVFTLLPLLTGEGRAHHGEILREGAKLVESGKIAVRVDPRHFSLATVREAYQALEMGGAAGKVVFDV